MLTLVLLLSVILATLVDPSCAVVMIPRLVNNDPDEMLMFLGQSNLVYSTSIDENVTAPDVQWVLLRHIHAYTKCKEI